MLPSEIRIAHRRGQLNQIGVDAGHRRKGIGLALIEAVRERLWQEGVTLLRASHWSFNEASAALMRRAGLLPIESIVEGPV